ncbi:LOG family protein [Pseudomonas sp. S9]|uniref:LOG family protein n=1 Tax=Pseudomonas sp. S9 TaxID=686578 RepID=UPI000255682F|nr:LOG family protein [Pseudomonas sp. S9]
MPYDADDYLARHFQASGIDLRSKVDELTSLIAPANSPNIELYREMLITVIRMGQADRNRWDAKIMLQTLREMEHAFCVLEQFKRRRKVTVFGSARTPVDHPIYQLGRELGAQLARHDLMVVTGAGGGIMAAAHEGAGLDNSLGFNITLPFEQSANATVSGSSHLLSFHFFFLRKLFFVKEADALVLCPGGFGTLDEAIEVLTLIQTGKSPLVPVVLLDQPGGSFWSEALLFIERQLKDSGYILASDLNLMTLVYSADDAVTQITRFYSNYNSSRWLNRQFIIRLNHSLNAQALTAIRSTFADICKADDFQLQDKAKEGQDTPELAHLPRLTFSFNGRNHGRLRELLDFINLRENWLSA